MTSEIDGNRDTTGTRAEEMDTGVDRYHRHQLTQGRAARALEATKNQQTGAGVTEYHADAISETETALTNDACDSTAPRTRMNAYITGQVTPATTSLAGSSTHHSRDSRPERS